MSDAQARRRGAALAHPFLEAIERGVVLADGATGTMLRERGWGGRNDHAVLDRPDLVRQLHEDYIEAGADLILTNTFTANRALLQQAGMGERVRDANFRAARLARDAREIKGAPVFVAGSVGPIGRVLAIGTWTLAEAEQAFEEQIGALVEGGVDVVFIETMPSLPEALAALRAARRVTADLPVVATMNFTAGLTSPAGERPVEIAQTLTEAGADVVGVNCGVGPQAALDMLQEMAGRADVAALAVKPNAGLPRMAGGRPVYPATPQYVANFALRAKDLGAVLIGGCCGTTPEHVRTMRAALAGAGAVAPAPGAASPIEAIDTRGGIAGFERGAEPAEPPAEQETLRLRDKLAAGKYVISVEIDPPRGISPRKAVQGAQQLAEAGADAINIGDSPMARVRMSALSLAVQIQQQVGIETIIHQTTRDRNLMALQSDLLGAHALGVRNVIALTGDPPSEASQSSAVWDVDSIGFIRVLKRLNEGVDFSGNSIGRPTEFFVACAANPTADDLDLEVRRVRAKVDAGADLLMTQPAYDAATVRDFFERLGPVDIPVLLGVMPLMSSRHAEFIHNELAGVVVPEAIRERMHAAGEAGAEAGLDIAMEHVEETRALDFVSGIYIMPSFGRYEVAAEMVRRIQGG